MPAIRYRSRREHPQNPQTAAEEASELWRNVAWVVRYARRTQNRSAMTLVQTVIDAYRRALGRVRMHPSPLRGQIMRGPRFVPPHRRGFSERDRWGSDAMIAALDAMGRGEAPITHIELPLVAYREREVKEMRSVPT